MIRAGLAIAAGALLAIAPAARAQVSVNPGALDALAPRTRPQTPPRQAAPRPAPRPSPRPAQRPLESTPAQTAPTPPAKLPTIPETPPAILALPPPVAVPLAHPPPPPVVPVANDAPGAVSPVKGGLRVTFGADRSDLNPATEAALREFARGAKAGEQAITIYAYATGHPEDPSTPRRLSLARALSARAVLISEGIPSTRIYPRALGPAGGDSDPDRVDVTAGVPGPPTSTASTQPQR